MVAARHFLSSSQSPLPPLQLSLFRRLVVVSMPPPLVLSIAASTSQRATSASWCPTVSCPLLPSLLPHPPPLSSSSSYPTHIWGAEGITCPPRSEAPPAQRLDISGDVEVSWQPDDAALDWTAVPRWRPAHEESDLELSPVWLHCTDQTGWRGYQSWASRRLRPRGISTPQRMVPCRDGSLGAAVLPDDGTPDGRTPGTVHAEDFPRGAPPHQHHPCLTPRRRPNGLGGTRCCGRTAQRTERGHFKDARWACQVWLCDIEDMLQYLLHWIKV